MKKEKKPEMNVEKAKIIAAVIPVILIVIVLAVTWIVNSFKTDKPDTAKDDIQQSIIDYTDESLDNDQAEDSSKEQDTNKAEPVKEDISVETPKPTAVPTATPYQEIMTAGSVDYSKIKFDKDAQLKEMMTYWADNNQKAIDDLANLDRFKAMSFKLSGTKDNYYYGEVDDLGQPDGKGIAVYADNQYYYGDFKNGARSGNGTWVHYHIHAAKDKTDLYTYHQYTGSWSNDLPDGEGSEHYEYAIENLKENVGYNNNLIGFYKAGLINGTFYLTNFYSNGNVKEWDASAKDGSWVYQNDNKDKVGRRTVQVDRTDKDNYIWLYPKDNVNIGVSCIISKNKN